MNAPPISPLKNTNLSTRKTIGKNPMNLLTKLLQKVTQFKQLF